MMKKLLLTSLVLVAAVNVAKAESEDDILSLLDASESEAPKGKADSKSASVLKTIIGKTTAEQNIFVTFFDQGDFEKSLYQWPVAFDGTSFAKTANGRALYAYLLFRNGITVIGLENLLAVEDPKDIAPQLLAWWKAAAPDTHPAWSHAVVKWHPAWTETFGVATEVRSQARKIFDPAKFELIQEMIKKTTSGTRERAMLEWQLVLALSLQENTGTAAKALNHLMKTKNNPISNDLMTMTAARLLYQNGYMDAALKYYEKVPKSSDYWMDAQEEMAWSHIRKGEPQNAIAITKTLVNPVFEGQVGPEPVFLRALSQLKICDYPAVVESLNTYRTRFKPRGKAMTELVENANTPAAQKYISRAKQGALKLTDLGADVRMLPRFVTRDEMLTQLIETEKQLEREGKLAGELYARSLSGGTGQVGFQARLEFFRQAVESRVQTARSATLNRIKSLAEEEVTEITQLLQKLHIVETELLQQISTAERVIQASSQKVQEKKGSTGSQSKDRVVFPVERETWFDELANYKVDIKKGCQAIRQ